MSRRFTAVTVALTAVVAFLVGAIVAGGVARSSVAAGPVPTIAARPISRSDAPGSLVSFADVVERINPAVVNIDATTSAREPRRRRGAAPSDGGEPSGGPLDFVPRPDRDTPRRGAGSGFIIDADGSILTNNHV